MKKIKKIIIYLPNLNGGGAEKVYTNLANAWIADGIDVIFILNQKSGPFIKKINKEIRIENLNINKIRKAIFLLPKIIKREKADICIAAMWPLTSIMVLIFKFFLLKTKLVLSDHVNLTESIKKETNFNFLFFKIILRITYRFADGIICVSKGVRENISQLSGINKNKIKVIYNPVILDNQIGKFYHYKKFKKKKNQLIILSVGSLKLQKNHEMLINAFSLLDESFNAKLIIVGSGPLKNKLLKLIDTKKNKEKMQIVDFDLDIEKYYLNSNIFVLTSDWEGFGNVLVEALHYGLKVISTDCKYGPSEILENGQFGDLIKVNNVNALHKILANQKKEYKNELIYKNYLRSMDYSVQKISKEYLQYFTEIL